MSDKWVDGEYNWYVGHKELRMETAIDGRKRKVVEYIWYIQVLKWRKNFNIWFWIHDECHVQVIL